MPQIPGLINIVYLKQDKNRGYFEVFIEPLLLQLQPLNSQQTTGIKKGNA